MEYGARLNGKADEVIGISASDLMHARLNRASDMKGMRPRPAVNENSAASKATFAMVNLRARDDRREQRPPFQAAT